MNLFMKPLYATAMLLLSAALGSAASITAREVSTTTAHPHGSKAKEGSAEFVFTRELRTEAALSPAEIAAGARVEVFYCRPAMQDRQLAGEASAPAKDAKSIATHKVSYEGAKNWKAYWAARVIIDGKVVATAAETDKALAWVKARKVTAAEVAK